MGAICSCDSVNILKSHALTARSAAVSEAVVGASPDADSLIAKLVADVIAANLPVDGFHEVLTQAKEWIEDPLTQVQVTALIKTPFLAAFASLQDALYDFHSGFIVKDGKNVCVDTVSKLKELMGVDVFTGEEHNIDEICGFNFDTVITNLYVTFIEKFEAKKPTAEASMVDDAAELIALMSMERDDLADMNKVGDAIHGGWLKATCCDRDISTSVMTSVNERFYRDGAVNATRVGQACKAFKDLSAVDQLKDLLPFAVFCTLRDTMPAAFQVAKEALLKAVV